MGVRTINVKVLNPLSDPDVVRLMDMLRAGGLVSSGLRGVDVPTAVGRIIDDVADRGDVALVELTEKFDGVRIEADSLRVSAEDISVAGKGADEKFMSAVKRAAENIREYQRQILVEDPPMLRRGSRELGLRYTPMSRVGLYVPGGRAVYASTVLMTVVPAQVAGVGEIIITSPPTSNGRIDPTILAVADLLGIEEVYSLGGAQAIAAMAMGTETIKPVDMIAGPGNAFVAEAKRQLFGKVAIDTIAGPSEVLIVADRTARADYIAADMLAQAEHDPGSAILVTTSRELAEEVAAEIESAIKKLSRAEAISESIERYSAIIVVDDIAQACRIADEFAPEHLQIITEDDEAVLGKIRNAGAIFLGSQTPVALGDYYAGPSHVLPTGGGARFSGPLSCNDFRKASSILKYAADALTADAADVITLAESEGLTAHAEAIKIRQIK